MPEQKGPFSEYLSAPAQPTFNPPRAQITGFEGPGAAVMLGITEFLRGASKSRAENFARQEQRRMQNIDAYKMLMNVAQNSGLPPQALQEFTSTIGQRLIGEVANADHGGEKGKGKGGGNPIFDAIKGMAGNLLGPTGGKAKPITEEEIGQHFLALNSAVQGHRKATSELDQQLGQAYAALRAKNSGGLDRQTILEDQGINNILSQGDRLGIDLRPKLGMYLSAAYTPDQMMLQGGLRDLAALNGGAPKAPSAAGTEPPQPPPNPVTAMADASGAAQMSVAPKPMSVETPPMSVAPPPLQGDPNLVASATPVIPRSTEPPRPVPPPVPPVQALATANGQEQVPALLGAPVRITPPMAFALSKLKAKPDEYFLYKGPNEQFKVVDYGPGADGKPLILRKGTNERVNPDVARQQGYKVLDTLPTVPQSAMPLDPKQVESARSAVKLQLEGAPFLNPTERQFASRLFEAQIGTNDLKGAADAVNSYVAQRQAAAERKAHDAESLAVRRELIAATRGVQAANIQTKYANDIAKLKPVDNFNKMADFLNQSEVAYKRSQSPDVKVKGYADLTLIRAVAHATDPTTGIRDAEQKTFQAADSFLKQWQMKVEQGWQNGSMLTEGARKEALEIVRAFHKEAKKIAVSSVTPFVRGARRAGLADEDVLPDSLRGAIPGGSGSNPPRPDSGNPYPQPGSGSGRPKGF